MPKTKKSSAPQKIPAEASRRMKDRPYYAFLYAKNILEGERLPEKLEQVFANDPQSAYLYAKHIIKGKLPDFIHTALVLCGNNGEESKHFVSKYLSEFCKD